MEALKETGLKKAIRFVIYTFLYSLYRVLIFPPFRTVYLKLLGGSVGSGTIIMGAKFFNWHQRGFSNLTIGKKCFIGDETLFDLYGRIELGDNVTIAPRVTVISHINVGFADHPLQKRFPKSSSPVIFEEGCMIGASSTILPGVTVGKNSFVAAGSLVSKDVPKNCLVAGVPAKIIKQYS